MNKSEKWLDSGSGDIGRVFLEIIGADELPNKDKNAGITNNKTDSFVSIVYEDCLVQTDVINDCLSPRWLPWMQRAFVFHMMHSSSQILVGVFDCDPGMANDHDFIGRFSIDLANLYGDKDYVLQYTLYDSSNLSTRKANGTLKVRLRIEVDGQKAVLSALKIPPPIYVNVRDEQDFLVARRTCVGKYDTEAYHTDMISAYMEELRNYKIILYYISDAVVSIVFWRGNFPLWFGKKLIMKIPLHSLITFILAVHLVERPALFPSFFFFSISWMLLAVMGYRCNNPNPWAWNKSFLVILQYLALGRTVHPTKSIASHEYEKESIVFNNKWKQRIAETEEATLKRNEDRMKQLAEHDALMAQIDEVETDISSNPETGSLLPNPLKPILYPIQQYLGMACKSLRFVRNLICWEECYYSFWLTAASFILGIIFIFIPWFFLFHWALRITVWFGFGPHMKLVDIFWYSKMANKFNEEAAEKDREDEVVQTAAAAARVQREELAKLKDMKQALYGHYSIKVPTLKIDRYPDIPLHTSMSAASEKKESNDSIQSVRIPGQHLFGNMIPKVRTFSEIGFFAYLV